MAGRRRVADDYTGDEALDRRADKPRYVVKPATAEEVAALLRLATEERTTRDRAGIGHRPFRSAARTRGGLVVSFERMNAILEIDTNNHVAVVQPGVTLAELDASHGARSAWSTPSTRGDQRQRRRQRRHQRGRHARGQVRRHPQQRPRPAGRRSPTGEIIRTGGRIVEDLDRATTSPS